MTVSVALRLTCAGVFAAAVFVAPASAAIKCKRGTQLVGGQWIATPYCQDQYLAEVARKSGFNASAAKIRNNPNYKKNLCQYMYSDIRVQQTCLDAGVPQLFGIP
jgi:hypothetical protein